MSVDYVKFMSGNRTILKHLQEVYLGNVDEAEQDHSHLVTSLIPVVLKSSISDALRAFVLRQYAEIQGNIRDTNLSLLERNSFYLQAADDVKREEDFNSQREVIGSTQFDELLGYFDDEDLADAVKKAAEEHEVFKNSMGDVIKSSLGLSSDSVIGPEEVVMFLEKDRDF